MAAISTSASGLPSPADMATGIETQLVEMTTKNQVIDVEARIKAK